MANFYCEIVHAKQLNQRKEFRMGEVKEAVKGTLWEAGNGQEVFSV